MDFLLTSPNQKIYIHENLGISKPDYVICIMHFPIQQCFFKAKKKKKRSVATTSEANKAAQLQSPKVNQ